MPFLVTLNLFQGPFLVLTGTGGTGEKAPFCVPGQLRVSRRDGC
jgi:hypothetical protein